MDSLTKARRYDFEAIFVPFLILRTKEKAMKEGEEEIKKFSELLKKVIGKLDNRSLEDIRGILEEMKKNIDEGRSPSLPRSIKMKKRIERMKRKKEKFLERGKKRKKEEEEEEE